MNLKGHKSNPKSAPPLSCIIVDDELSARQRLEGILLASNDFLITGSYGDPKLAFRHIIKEQPDIVFLDIEMPGMNGFEMERAMRIDRCKSRIVFVTANLRYINELKMGDNVHFLIKPVDSEELKELLLEQIIHSII